jgi:hypothetical protein
MVLALFSFSENAVAVGIGLAVVLAVALWGPFLWKEIRKGKAELGPNLPSGTSEPHPGRKGDPAHGHPDGQPNPYNPRSMR